MVLAACDPGALSSDLTLTARPQSKPHMELNGQVGLSLGASGPLVALRRSCHQSHNLQTTLSGRHVQARMSRLGEQEHVTHGCCVQLTQHHMMERDRVRHFEQIRLALDHVTERTRLRNGGVEVDVLRVIPIVGHRPPLAIRCIATHADALVRHGLATRR